MRANKESYMTIKLDALELNDGQLQGVPKNPRFIKDEKFEDLKQSIRESPEFLRANTLKVYQLKNKNYIVIGGNMRLRACRELQMKEVPCYVFPQSTTLKKLREYAIKDNMAYGQIDWESNYNSLQSLIQRIPTKLRTKRATPKNTKRVRVTQSKTERSKKI